MTLTDALVAGLLHVLAWPAVGFLVLGVLIGILFGAVPGLSGLLGLVILIPFTFGMDPVSAFALLLGMFAVTTTGDTIASVMLGIPGTAASQATILDGYPLATQGQAERALGAAFTCSAVGGVLGGVALAVSLPIVLPVILAFGSPEFFMLGVLGLTMVGALSGGSVLKGIATALFGLLLSMVGYAEVQAVPRYWFGFEYALDGLTLIPIVLGLFAIPEVMDLAVRNTSISRVPRSHGPEDGVWRGIRDVARHWWLVIRSSAIGMYIGIIPGLGASIVDWVAYGHAVQSAKDKSRFGKGDIRGVIAPESANNAQKGAALIPTVAFGIPGGAAMAILLSALLIQGLRPGPDMLTTHLDLTFSMVWTLIIANVLVAALLLLSSRHIAALAFLPGHLIVPVVVLFVLMGAWIEGASLGDWLILFVMGAVGFAMKKSGWPRPPLILGFVLGPIMENALQITMRVHRGGLDWLLRPVSLVIMAIIALTLYAAGRGIARTRRAGTPAAGEGAEHSPLISLPLAIALFAAFIGATMIALDWPYAVRLFPLVIAVPASLLLAAVILRDAVELRRALGKIGGNLGALARRTAADAEFDRVVSFLGWILATMLATVFVDQYVAIPLFMGLYILRWGGFRWPVAVAYALSGLAVLYGFYDRVVHVFFYRSLLFG